MGNIKEKEDSDSVIKNGKNDSNNKNNNHDNDYFIVNVFNIVRKLREQRSKMVTTSEQYQFIYECVVNWVNTKC